MTTTAVPRTARRAIALVAVAVVALLVEPPRASASREWTWPVHGRVITPYVNDNSRPYAGGMHRGIDIEATVGTPVVAAHSGRVTYAGALGSSGRTVAVENTDGADGRYVTSYLHLSEIGVHRGEVLAAGQKLGAVGTTGSRSAAEPHLHFGVRLAGDARIYIDPLTLLPPFPQKPQQTPAPTAVRVRTEAAPAPTVAPLTRSPVSPPEWAGAPQPAGTPVPEGLAVPRHRPAMQHRPPGTKRAPIPGLPVRSRSPAHAARPGTSRGRSVRSPAGAPAGTVFDRRTAGRSSAPVGGGVRRGPAERHPFPGTAVSGSLLSIAGVALIALSLAGGAVRRWLSGAPRRTVAVYERIGATIARRSARPRRLERRPSVAPLK
jgi:hypothetical protein